MTDKKDKVLAVANDIYTIFIGDAAQNEDVKETFLTYKIVNTKTGVTEGETTILPRAYGYAEAFYDDLSRAGKLRELDAEPAVLVSAMN